MEKQQIRILVAPDRIAAGDRLDQFLSLRHPKSGQSACYLFADEKLLELHRFKLPYGSWFLGDYVCKDGCLFMATPVDPVFILLPIFENARMKKGDEPGKFRQLDEIMFVDGYPAYHDLFSVAERSMHVVCEVKDSSRGRQPPQPPPPQCWQSLTNTPSSLVSPLVFLFIGATFW